jgi:hypothetical protein
MSAWNQWRSKHPKTSIQLVGADFENAALEKADLECADLRAANLQRAMLAGANLRDANLNGALLFNADLRNVDFQGAFLYGADLSGVNLEGANFFDADLTMANLKGAKLSGLRFDSMAVLKDLAHPLSEKQIVSAVFAERNLQKNKAALTREKQYQEGPDNPPIDNAPAHPEKSEVPANDQNSEAPANSPNSAAIVRSIVFDRENMQVGIGILNYFGEILRQKYEDNTAKIIIAQEGLNAQLTVMTVEREKRIIEKTLEDYIAVVAGRQQISAFLPEPLSGIALKQKLDLAYLELKQTQALHSPHIGHARSRNAASEDNIQRLHQLLSEHIIISRQYG